MEIQVYRFTERMPVFMELARESYVGPRIYPLAAFLYAVMNVRSTILADGRISQDTGTFLEVRDIITEFVRDRYFSDIQRRQSYGTMEDDLDVPRRLLRESFNEIIRGSTYLEDVASGWIKDHAECLSGYRVVPDLVRGALVVVRH